MVLTHLTIFSFLGGASTLAAPTGFGGFITHAFFWALDGFGLVEGGVVIDSEYITRARRRGRRSGR